MSTVHRRNTGRLVAPAIGALLRRAWQMIRLRIYTGIRADGYDDLTAAHISIFRYETIDGRRPTQLAEEMQITKQSLNDLLRQLENRGYIKLELDRVDRRARLIRLTARGRQLDSAVLAHAHQAEQEFEKIIGKQQFKIFHDTLIKITQRTDSNTIK